ncbi:MAG: hypothetical protein WCS18_12110 [Sphaerochaetaceae bacterium]
MSTSLTKTQTMEEMENSLSIPRGSLWKWPDFGHRFKELKGCTEETRIRAAAFAKEAIQWMEDLGHITDVSTSAAYDINDETRLLILVSANMPTGEYVQFKRWVEVL